MGKYLDKLTSFFGFSKNYDDYDDYEDYDEYDQYDDYNEEPVQEKKSYRSSTYGRNSSTRDESRYDEPEYEESAYRNTRSSYSGSSSAASSYARNRNSKVVNINNTAQMKVVVASPETLEEAKEIAQSLKERKPVVINLEFVEKASAQRITDFLCGACYALNGNIKRIADRIFMIVPENVSFAGDNISERLKEDGLAFTWQED